MVGICVIFAACGNGSSKQTESVASKPAAAEQDDRPSPVAESIESVVKRRVETKTQTAPAPGGRVEGAKDTPPREDSSSDSSTDWAVIAATHIGFESAQRRATSLKSRWKDCDCRVYPPSGEGSKYYVLVGAGLDRNAADRLRDRATSAGMPQDTYVSKLIKRSESSQ